MCMKVNSVWNNVLLERYFVEKKASEKETETTLFTTEATQQKEHTTHNLYICIRCHFGRAILPMCEYNLMVRTPKAAKAETTQQKEHTTPNYSIYSSIAISVHCCLHGCSHITSIPPSCTGVRTLPFSSYQFASSNSCAYYVPVRLFELCAICH